MKKGYSAVIYIVLISFLTIGSFIVPQTETSHANEEIVIPDEWNFRRFPNQNRMQLDPAENLESDTNAFVGWAFAFDNSPLSD